MKASSDFNTGYLGIFWMGFMTLFNYFVQLVIIYFLARLLSPSDYGEVAAVTILIGIAELFWMLGVGPAIVQKKDIDSDDITTGNTLNILFGLIVFSIINIFALFWVKVFSISDILMLRAYSVIFILNSISGVSQSLSQRKCKFRKISFINSTSIIIYGGIAIALALLKLGPWALVYASILQTVFTAIAFLIFEPTPFRLGIKKDSAGKLLYFGTGFTIAKFFNYVATKGDSFVVIKTMGKIELGLFTKAQQLLMYPVILVGDTLDKVLFPLLSKSQGDEEKLRRVFLNGTGSIALLTAPIAIVAFFRANELIGFILGDKWIGTVAPFKVLIIGLFFRTAYKLSDSLIRAIGQVYKRAVIQVVYAMMVIVGAYFGHFYGLMGVALGVTIAFTVNYILMTGLSMFLVKIKVKDIIVVLFPSVVYCFITAIVTFEVNPYLSSVINDFISFAVTTIFVFALYAILFILLSRFTMTKELRCFINALLSRVYLVKR